MKEIDFNRLHYFLTGIPLSEFYITNENKKKIREVYSKKRYTITKQTLIALKELAMFGNEKSKYLFEKLEDSYITKSNNLSKDLLESIEYLTNRKININAIPFLSSGYSGFYESVFGIKLKESEITMKEKLLCERKLNSIAKQILTEANNGESQGLIAGLLKTLGKFKNDIMASKIGKYLTAAVQNKNIVAIKTAVGNAIKFLKEKGINIYKLFKRNGTGAGAGAGAGAGTGAGAG